MSFNQNRRRVFFKSLYLWLVIAVPGTASSAITNPNALWIFGDSYSDIGNFYISSGNTVPSSALGYDNGRWTDGAMWVEHLASALSLPALVPGFNFSGNAGTNLAVGGALTDTTNSQVPTAGSGMRSQVDGFRDFYNPFIPAGQNAGSLFVVFGGANNGYKWLDINDTALLDTLVDEAMTDIDGIVRDLHSYGAQYFLMPNLPGFTVPDDWFVGSPAGTIAFAQGFNAGLATKIAELRADLGVEIVEVDFFGLFQDLLTNTTDGITNISAPCLDLNAVGGFEGLCGNPEQYLMFDAIHPSAAAHEAMADAAFAALVPIPAALPLFLSAVFGIGFWSRIRTPN